MGARVCITKWLALLAALALLSLPSLGAGETADVAFDQRPIGVECQETASVVVVVSIDPEAELEPSTFKITFDTTYLEVTNVESLVSGDTGVPSWSNTTGIITHSQAWSGAGPVGGDIDVLRITLKGKAVTPAGSPPDLAFVGGSGNTVIYVDGVDATGTLTDSPVSVEDTTPPEITLIGSATITLECCTDSYIEQGADRNDTCCITDTVSVGGDVVDECVVGTYEVTYNVSDCASNPADEVVRTVVVQDTIDPVFTHCPGNLLLACDHETNGEDVESWLDSATATDTCGSVTISDDYARLSGGCSTNTGAALVTWTAQDESGNTATCQATLTVLSDTSAPWFDELPADLLVLESELWSADIASLTASDVCDAHPQVRYMREIGDRRGTSYILERVYEARDACGNSVAHSQLVAVVVVPPDVVVTSGDPIDPSHTGTIAALGDQRFETSVEYSDDWIAGCPGRIQRTWTVYDQRDPDRSVEATQWITIQDTSPPSVEWALAGTAQALSVLLTASEPLSVAPLVTLDGNTVDPVVSSGEDRRIYGFAILGGYENGALLEALLADACGNASHGRAWLSSGSVDSSGRLAVADDTISITLDLLRDLAGASYVAALHQGGAAEGGKSLALELLGPTVLAGSMARVSVEVRRSIVELLLSTPPPTVLPLLLTIPGRASPVVLQLLFMTDSDSYVGSLEFGGAQ